MDAQPHAVTLQQYAHEFIEGTRAYVYIRPEDGLLVLRPSRTYYLNKMAVRMLDQLYSAPDGPDAEAVVAAVAGEYGVEAERVRDDLRALLGSLQDLLANRYTGADNIKEMRFRSHPRNLPVLSEIALTYRCQNRCTFCYADAPSRGRQVPEMTTDQVKVIIDRIFDEAHCPTVSFTGGEPTLRDDLPELVAYAHSKAARGVPMRVNLITNGLRCADADFVRNLAEAGLDSAQLSLEGPTADVHDAITQHPGAWELAVQGVHTLRAAGIHTHTNTTICGGNRAHLLELVDFIADELQSEYFSMNMVIRTGTALVHAEDDITYTEIGGILQPVQQRAAAKGVHLVWYSPTPYCMFNPVTAGLSSKSCACVDGLLSVNPAGQLLPCSSFEQGIGDLLRRPFAEVWNSRTALYWRRKEFVPPMCQRCEVREICCGACPLYWAQRKSFAELEPVAPGGSPLTALGWAVRKQLWSGTRGVGL